MKKLSFKKIITLLIYLLIIPFISVLGYFIFKSKNYNLISIIICLLAMVPFFINFEVKRTSAREIVIIASMVALSVIGRIAFAAAPGFKPITAIIIITGMAFGGEAGFIVGALSALISNIFFGQGPWTPFQMFAWGFVGLISGIFKLKSNKTNYLFAIIFGIFSGIIYSLIMDIWTTISVDKTFEISRYFFFVSTSFTFLLIYSISNAIFIALMYFPLTKKLARIKTKYLVFDYH